MIESRASFASRFGRSAKVMAGVVVLCVLAGLCLLAPVIAWLIGVDPYSIDPSLSYAGPSARHWLGTDELGRDLLARLLYGGRYSLAVAIVGAGGTLFVGAALGLVAGFTGGLVDALVMRAAEAVMSLPRLPLMMLLLALDPAKTGFGAVGRTGSAVVVLLATTVAFGWTETARIARACALGAKAQEHVEAARSSGVSDVRILMRHIFPFALGPLLVAGTQEVGKVVLLESLLSYLGLGVPPPMPSWGAMLHNGMTALREAPAVVLLPGLLTVATVAAVNAVGDGVRDALDPRGDR